MRYSNELTMKMVFIIIGIILAGGLVYYLSNSNRIDNPLFAKGKDDNSIDSLKIENQKNSPFEGLRNQAFSVSAQQIGLSISDSEVYGVIMDWNLGNGIMTLVTYKTGDASIYLSSGGGIIGGGQHENVNKAAKAFVNKADRYSDKVIKADSTPLPEKDCVRFYFLTKNGKYCAQEQMAKFENESSLWLDYFNEANKVITELRQTAD
jgi:hypothetical protein